MVMDGLNLLASYQELKQLIGGKIDKIQQVERDELIVGVRANNKNYKLLISASPANARIHITNEKRTSPIEAPMFCMLLRKRLTGAKISSVEQPNSDRVIIIALETRNELGDNVEYKLISEIMGKYSNIILINENGIIVDSIKHVGVGMSNVRLILPGLNYEFPPSQNKKDPVAEDEEGFYTTLCDSELKIEKTLSASYFGLAPVMASALISSFGECSTKEIARKLSEFYKNLSKGKFQVSLALNEYSEPIGVYPFIYAETKTKMMDSVGEAFDEYCKQHDIIESLQRKSVSIRRKILNNIERCEKKLALHSDALNSTESMEKFRLYGELLTANLYNNISIIGDNAIVDNYYMDPPDKIEIPIDKRFSINTNSQRYFKKYQKLKSAREIAAVQYQSAFEEKEYLEGQLDNLDKCTNDIELAEVTEELVNLGYIKRENKNKSKINKTNDQSKPMCYVGSNDVKIYVGKNNKQNETLTLRFANSDDMWLHTKNIPGSHVIIKNNGNISDENIYEAAMLAAYYSKGRGSENVPVDYTLRKNVKKPSGAKPGMVIYTTNRTIYVTPNEEFVKQLNNSAN